MAAILVVAACGGVTPSVTPSSSTVAPSEPASPSASSSAVDWHDPTQTPAARAAALLAAMTLDEKIGQMTQLENHSVDPARVTALFLGSVLSGGGGSPPENTPAAWYAMVDAYQKAALATRLGIPILYGVDAVHGHNNVVGATIFPHEVGLGAAGDPALVEQIGRATAVEMAATGIRWDFGPVVAVPQDVRWGRTYEGYGEDPARVSRLASAFITGLQGPDLAATDAVAATAKHFLGDGGTAFGSSTTDGYLLDQGVTEVDEATLRAVHLPPYEAAIKAGARIVMASFSSTTAGKVHGDRHLLTDLLKGELGFSGFVVSDWGGVDQVDPDYTTAVARAIEAGIDMVMVPSDGVRFQAAVRAGLASGAIEASRVDDAVLRILRVKFELGLFEHPMPPAGHAGDVGSDADRALARKAVAASLVLLKTAKGVLPVGPTDTVLLTGPGADDVGFQSGGWTISWQGGSGNITPGTTIADALRVRLGARLSTFPGPSDIPAGARAAVGDRRPGRAAICRRSGRFGVTRDRHRQPLEDRPAEGRSPDRRHPVGTTSHARPGPSGRGRRRRSLAARHGRRRCRGRPARRTPVHGDDALHLARRARARAQDREDALRGSRLPARLRAGRDRQDPRSGRLSVGFVAAGGHSIPTG